ncbi:MAG: hypothetical protein V1746_00470 [bacterium]
MIQKTKQGVKRTLARVVDGAAFGFIHALQLRSKAGQHSRRDFEDYVVRWQGASLEDYYAIPKNFSHFDLPDSGPAHFETAHPTGCAENDCVHLRVWPGTKGRRSPAMILLHSFMSVSDVGYRLWARHLNDLGWTAVFFDLPYHYRRKPKGIVSGEIALSSNLILTAETIRQGVIDLRRLCRSLQARGAPHVGCWATSYGGWLASMLCVTEKTLTTAWLNSPIVDVNHVIWSSPAACVIRRQLRKRDIHRHMVKPHLRLVCPTFHHPLTPPHQILLLAGLLDQISPAPIVRNLHQKWTGSHYAELWQGHIGYQMMPASWRLAREKMPQLFA